MAYYPRISKKRKCYNCGKTGHYAKNCYARKRKR